VVHLGFEVRLELELRDGSEARAQLTRAQAAELEVDEGDIVYVRPPAGVPIEPSLRAEINPGRRPAAATTGAGPGPGPGPAEA
jgi:hypothetical protein